MVSSLREGFVILWRSSSLAHFEVHMGGRLRGRLVGWRGVSTGGLAHASSKTAELNTMPYTNANDSDKQPPFMRA